MILACMQPYFFPYIGYFQLLDCSDIFVVADDLQYIKGGWINRNRILIDQKPSWLTFPIRAASMDLYINERYYVDGQKERNKILRRIENAYRNAPYFKDIYPVIERLMYFGSSNVSEFNTNAIRCLKDFLNIQCEIQLSSELKKNNALKCQDRVIEINRCLNATHYVNPIGGISLYQEKKFVEYGIGLSFIRADYICYRQFFEPFIPSLSIIDVLMFCSLDEVKRLLKKFRLIKHAEIA